MILKAENLSFGYGKGRAVLEDVSFSLKSGEILGLYAPSGFGKTTLVKLLAGYLTPQKGSITIDDKPINGKGFSPVQLIFQHPEKAVNPKWRMKKILEESGSAPDTDLMKAMGIRKDWLNRWPAELSGGELQRFCVLRALTPNTKFLIADEMTTMLDAITQVQIWQTVLNYAKSKDMGILAISHDRSLLDRLCHKTVNLANVYYSSGYSSPAPCKDKQLAI